MFDLAIWLGTALVPQACNVNNNIINLAGRRLVCLFVSGYLAKRPTGYASNVIPLIWLCGCLARRPVFVYLFNLALRRLAGRLTLVQ